MDSGLLHNRNYRWWFAADTLGVLSGVTKYLAVSLVAFALTGSKTLTAAVTTATFVAALLGALPGGVITDRCRRTTLMKVSGLVAFAVNGTLATLLILGILSYWFLVVALALQALLSGLFGSASDAALKSVVNSEDYASAMAANQGRDSAVSLAASPASGLLYMVGAAVPFACAAACGLGATASASRIQEDYNPSKRNSAPSFTAQVREGFTWIWSRPQLRTLLVVNGIVTLGIITISTACELRLIASGVTPAQIGLLGAAMGGAMLAGAGLAGSVIRRYPTGLLAIAGLAWMFLWGLPLLIIDTFAVMVLSLGMQCLLLPFYSAPLDGYYYSQVPHELQGRAFSLASVVQLSLAASAPMLAALFLQWGDLRAAAALSSAMLLTALVAVAGKSALRTLSIPAEWPSAAEKVENAV